MTEEKIQAVLPDFDDMLVEDRIIRNIPHWVKYSGLKQIASESV